MHWITIWHTLAIKKQSVMLLTLPSRPDSGHQQIVHDPYVTSLLTFQPIIVIQV